MIENYNLNEIDGLIVQGFGLEIISMESGIPIQYLKSRQKRLEQEKKPKVVKAQEIIDKENEKAHSKMEQMRDRYNRLYYKTGITEKVERPKQLTKEELETINSSIKSIQDTIKTMSEYTIKMDKAGRKERRQQAYLILTELRKIEKYPLTVAQSEELCTLIHSEKLKNVRIDITDDIQYFINTQRKIIIKKLAKAIDIAQSETEKIEELKSLERKLTNKMAKEHILVGVVITRIRDKRLKISQREIFDKIRNNIPENIESIINDIAQGTLDIEKANEIIINEAKLRVESKPKTKFSLTEEQERKQILIQISKALTDNPDKYYIENPEIAITQIQELLGEGIEQSVRTVVRNLIGKKDFKRANYVFDKYFGKNRKSELSKSMKFLRSEIKNAEIGDIVLKGLNMNNTIEEERAYIELLEKGLKKGNINLGAINLGKSKDGLRTITLADIWTDENQREKLV